MFREHPAIEIPSKVQPPSEVQAALDRQAALFKELGLDDQDPQSGSQTNDRSHMLDNPYALLQDLDPNDDAEPQSAPSRPPVHTMMPPGGSPFWTRYGNKLRVNGTVEEVCVIR